MKRCSACIVDVIAADVQRQGCWLAQVWTRCRQQAAVATGGAHMRGSFGLACTLSFKVNITAELHSKITL